MNLLIVSPFFPSPSSGAPTRTYELIKALSRRYDVSLIVLVADATDDANDRALADLKLRRCVKVSIPASWRRKRIDQLLGILRGRSRLLDAYRIDAVQQAIDGMFASDRYDVVLFESVFMADYQLPEGTQVIIDEHNIEHELLDRMFRREKSLVRKWYNWWESRKVKPAELARCRNARGVLVTSRREAQLLRPHLPDNEIAVVPNGVAVDAFLPAEHDEALSDSIIFTGAMDYYPNMDAVVHFARESWPLVRRQAPAATWQIVGRNPPRAVLELAKLPGVTVSGSVPDVKPYLAAASVAIAPLRIGSGTRLKILEALAMGKAVVSTSLGCEGLDVVSGKHLLVADEPAEFARAIVDLFDHAEKRKDLGAAGRTLAEGQYSWQRCGNDVLRAVESMTR
jgi:sugar transferase (PEP-CTERM/EpsH1 system associated)